MSTICAQVGIRPRGRPSSTSANRRTGSGLKIVATHDGGGGDSEGTVEFVARYKIAGRAFRLHEISRFVRQADRWTYFSGTPGRSDSRAKAAEN